MQKRIFILVITLIVFISVAVAQNTEKVFFNNALIYYQDNKYSEAIASINKAIEMAESKESFLLYNLTKIEIYFSGENFDKAFETADEIMALYPDSCINVYVKAKELISKGMYREAIAEMEKTLPLPGERAHYYNLYGIVCFSENYISNEPIYAEKALEAYIKMLDYVPKPGNYYYLVAYCAWKSGKYVNNESFILEYLDKAIEEIPNFIDALSLLTFINYLSGNGKEALSSADTCLDYIKKRLYHIFNDDNLSYYTGMTYSIKGYLTYLTGDYESAIKYITNAIFYAPEDASLYRARSEIYKTMAEEGIRKKKNNSLANSDIKKMMELQKEFPNKNVFLCSPNEDKLKESFAK